MTTKITTHSADALLRLLEQYRGKDNIESLFTPFLTQVQEWEDAVHEMLELLEIDTMDGVTLDTIGALVGRVRPASSTTDAIYRVLIKAQIGANTSEGIAQDVLAVFDILKSTNEGSMTEYYPACLGFYIEGSLSAEIEDNFIELVSTSVAASIEVFAVKFSDTDPLILGWDGLSDPTTLGKGLSWTGTLDQGKLGWSL